MQDSRRLESFLSEYERYIAQAIKPTRDELKEVLKAWKQPAFWSRYVDESYKLPNPSPIQRFEIRIKRPESAYDKISRKSSDYPRGPHIDSLQRMYDVLGCRIVVYFVSQLHFIDTELRHSKVLELSPKHPPVAYLEQDLLDRFKLGHVNRLQKESGYASIHYYVRLRNSTVPRRERPWVEVQVRTLAEDIWACVEHIIGYKPHKRTSFPVTKQFQILSKQLATIDEHFNFLFEELSRFQQEGVFTDADPLNPENLPQVVSTLGIRCSQSEIDGLLRLLNSRGLSTVGDLRKAGTKQRGEKIKVIYQSEKARIPTSFEFIAQLANLGLRPLADEEEEQLIRAQIKFLDAWDKLRRGFA